MPDVFAFKGSHDESSSSDEDDKNQGDATEPMAIEIDEQEPPGEGYMYSLETESFFQQSPEREREEEEEDNEGERQAVVEGEAAVQNWDQEFDQPVWSENLTVESERMRGHYPQDENENSSDEEDKNSDSSQSTEVEEEHPREDNGYSLERESPFHQEEEEEETMNQEAQQATDQECGPRGAICGLASQLPYHSSAVSQNQPERYAQLAAAGQIRSQNFVANSERARAQPQTASSPPFLLHPSSSQTEKGEEKNTEKDGQDGCELRYPCSVAVIQPLDCKMAEKKTGPEASNGEDNSQLSQGQAHEEEDEQQNLQLVNRNNTLEDGNNVPGLLIVGSVRCKSREDKGDREGIPHTHPVPQEHECLCQTCQST
ncbi:unnamed protein product [Porites evermanni]|uniref:Uncharacterized protein n=1 Tax=Porites evermanni TaxID=104178 RepID=A0ABN8MBM9_9CNID|nr:unnamed protein product [Porites evermanni]